MVLWPRLPSDIQTPCLIVDRDVLEQNLVAMADHARGHGVALRPHAKTHKCLEIARRQLALGAIGLTVATVGEAEVFAAAGFNDLFIAYPVWAAGARAARLRALAERVALRVGVDSRGGVEVMARALAGDRGGSRRRSRQRPPSQRRRTRARGPSRGDSAAPRAARGWRFHLSGARLRPQRKESRRQWMRRRPAGGRAALRQAGVGAGLCSGGSTPTAALLTRGALNEMRPGVYVFNDAQQVELGAAD